VKPFRPMQHELTQRNFGLTGTHGGDHRLLRIYANSIYRLSRVRSSICEDIVHGVFLSRLVTLSALVTAVVAGSALVNWLGQPACVCAIRFSTTSTPSYHCYNPWSSPYFFLFCGFIDDALLAAAQCASCRRCRKSQFSCFFFIWAN